MDTNIVLLSNANLQGIIDVCSAQNLASPIHCTYSNPPGNRVYHTPKPDTYQDYSAASSYRPTQRFKHYRSPRS